MTSHKNVSASESKKQAAPDANRRNLAFSMLGLLGGSALLKACALPASEESAAEENVATAMQALSGVEVRWADTVFGSGGPTNRINGDLNKAPSGVQNAILVIVKGAESRGDGGGGIFYWDTTPGTDDGGTVIVPTAGPLVPGCWRRIYEGPLNAKWFGTTNMTLAIQNAVNAGKHVYIPPGIHTITKAIDMQEGVELYGAAAATVLKLQLAAAPAVDSYDGAVIKIQKNNVRIFNLVIDGNKTQANFVNKYDNAGIVIAPSAVTPTSDVSIENCTIKNCAGTGVVVKSSHRVSVRSCSVNDNGQTGSRAAGIEVIGGSQGCVVQGCDAWRNLAEGIMVLDQAEQTRIRDCRTDTIVVTASTTMIVGCQVDNSNMSQSNMAIRTVAAAQVTVANCRITSRSHGIFAQANANLVINGNAFASSTNVASGLFPRAIWATDQSELGITNNSIRGTFNEGVRLEDSRHASVCDNALASVDTSGAQTMAGVGISLSDTAIETAVSGNTIRGYKYGVREDAGTSNLVTANVLRGNAVAYSASLMGSIVDHNIV